MVRIFKFCWIYFKVCNTACILECKAGPLMAMPVIITVTRIIIIVKGKSLSVSTEQVNEHSVSHLCPLYLVHQADTEAFKCFCVPERS